MFGFIAANIHDLSESEIQRYQAWYCGLCHTLKDRHGNPSRFVLTYDLTFLTILLNSLYEPEEQTEMKGCVFSATKMKGMTTSRFSEYAADMSIALAYHKCLDDWNDDRKASAMVAEHALKKHYEQVKKKWPDRCELIESILARINQLEQSHLAAQRTFTDEDTVGNASTTLADETPENAADLCANLFGMLLGRLFVIEDDIWAETLHRFGAHLGRFIYFMDAAVDLPQDKKKGSYNPFAESNPDPSYLKPFLMSLMGRAADQFERLPLERDVHLLRSIIYVGAWQQFAMTYELSEAASDDSEQTETDQSHIE